MSDDESPDVNIDHNRFMDEILQYKMKMGSFRRMN